MVKKKKKVFLQCKRPGLEPWVRKIPQRRAWPPTPVVLLAEFHGQRSLVSTVQGSQGVRQDWVTHILPFQHHAGAPERQTGWDG